MFTFSALPQGSGGGKFSPLMQRKRSKKGGDVTSEIEALRLEELDSSVQEPVQPIGDVSYANMLKNPVERFSRMMVEDFELSAEDCIYSQGKHGRTSVSLRRFTISWTTIGDVQLL